MFPTIVKSVTLERGNNIQYYTTEYPAIISKKQRVRLAIHWAGHIAGEGEERKGKKKRPIVTYFSRLGT